MRYLLLIAFLLISGASFANDDTQLWAECLRKANKKYRCGKIYAKWEDCAKKYDSFIDKCQGKEPRKYADIINFGEEDIANDVLHFRGQEKMYRLRLSPSTTVEDIIFLVNNVIWFQVDEAVKNKCAGKDAFYFEEA